MKHHDQSQKKELKSAAKSLSEALLSLQSQEEVKLFLEDLCTPAEIEAEFRTEYDFTHADTGYFRAILEGVIYHQPDIDAAFAAYLDRDIKQLTPVELALLRQAVFELRERPDVPFKVVISEAVALARKFGATDGHKYINGVLDRAASNLRAAEFQAR